MKKYIKRILYNQTFPVLTGSLKGLKLKVNDLIKASIFFNNYEPEMQSAFIKLMKGKRVFFDIGANVGLHSYFVSKNIENVKIFAFEPLPVNIEYLKETIKNNNIKNIDIIETAVSSESGEVYFDLGSDNSKGMINKAHGTLKVKVQTLDSFTKENNIYPDVLKIDVEGAEFDVLLGAEEMMKIKQPIFIIELHNPQQDLKVASFLSRHNYTIFRLNSDSSQNKKDLFLTIKNIQTSWPDIDGVWGNIVAIPMKEVSEIIG